MPRSIARAYASRDMASMTGRTPGIRAASRSGTPRIADGSISGMLAMSFIHFAERMSSAISTCAAWESTAATCSSRSVRSPDIVPTENQVSAGANSRTTTPGSYMLAAMPSTQPIERSAPRISATASIVMPFCRPTKTEVSCMSGRISSAVQRVS